MANNNYTQAALAADTRFRIRVKGALSEVAWQVSNEADATPNHQNRVQYAGQVQRQLENEVQLLLPNFVFRPNVMQFETTYVYDFATQSGQVVTASGDPDLASQLATDWDDMAAAAGFFTAAP